MSKNSKKRCKKHINLKLNLLLLKCFSITHNFLDWYKILATQTRLVCTTLPIFLLENELCMKKKKPPKFTIIQNVKILNFELVPNIQNNLDWHENCTTITRLKGKHNPTSLIENQHLMKEIQAPGVATIKCSLVYNLLTLIGLQKINTS